MDDFIPCKWNKPVFTRANGNELWVLFLEKAYAKIHGSYDRIVGGWSNLAMRDLTGAPGYSYVIDKEKDMFEKIVEADSKDYILAISCGNSDLEKQAGRDLGLVINHSYSIISAKTVTDGNGDEV